MGITNNSMPRRSITTVLCVAAFDYVIYVRVLMTTPEVVIVLCFLNMQTVLLDKRTLQGKLLVHYLNFYDLYPYINTYNFS